MRGLVWRSHPDQAHFSEQENLHLVETVNEAGGEVLLDERVRRDGSHHQKLFVVRHPDRPDDDVAFVGGIDLCHGRRDDERHRGRRAGDRARPRATDRGRRGTTSSCEVRGPAVGDLAWTFRERWEDPTPLDHRNPWRALIVAPRRASLADPIPLPPMPADPAPAGSHAVQVLRTYPAKRPPHPFAPDGERSIARAYLKAFDRARRLVYVEDQYLWSGAAAGFLADRLRAEPGLHLVAVVPRYPDQDGALSGPPYRIGQQQAIEQLTRRRRRPGGVLRPRGAVRAGRSTCTPRCASIDDVWMIVGSDNLNLRSWTNDSELSCAVLDDRRDEREPRDPGGLGDGARALARDTRLRLWREHLGRDDGDDADLVDGVAAIEVLRRAADDLDAWHGAVRRRPRPPVGCASTARTRCGGGPRWWAQPIHRALVDPDGRPRPCAAPAASDACVSGRAPALDEAEHDLGNFRQHEVADHRDEADPPLVAVEIDGVEDRAAGRRSSWPGT